MRENYEVVLWIEQNFQSWDDSDIFTRNKFTAEITHVSIRLGGCYMFTYQIKGGGEGQENVS